MNESFLTDYWRGKIDHELNNLPRLVQSGKIVLTLEINCGPGGVINDIDSDTRVKRKLMKEHR